jgi:5-methylcytosine-specific restriction protein A
MLHHIRHLYHAAMDLLHGKPAKRRSGQWPTVEREHLEREPVCQVCGGKKQLNVHHKKPYHLFPELELADGTGLYCQIKDALGRFVNNLITLCNAKRCHITFGHGGDFKAYNADVEADVKHARKMIENRKYEAA